MEIDFFRVSGILCTTGLTLWIMVIWIYIYNDDTNKKRVYATYATTRRRRAVFLFYLVSFISVSANPHWILLSIYTKKSATFRCNWIYIYIFAQYMYTYVSVMKKNIAHICRCCRRSTSAQTNNAYTTLKRAFCGWTFIVQQQQHKTNTYVNIMMCFSSVLRRRRYDMMMMTPTDTFECVEVLLIVPSSQP